jgi:hypothetical protein
MLSHSVVHKMGFPTFCTTSCGTTADACEGSWTLELVDGWLRPFLWCKQWGAPTVCTAFRDST